MSHYFDLIEEYLKPTDVHELKRERNFSAFEFCIVNACLLVGHALNLYWVFFQGLSLFWGGLLHLIFVGLAGFYAMIKYQMRSDARYALLLFIGTSLTGAFGAAGTLIMTLINLLFHSVAHGFYDWYYAIFPPRKTSLPEIIHEDILTGRDESSKRYSVVPFLDVMTIGSDQQKRDALSRMMLMFHPSFAPALQKGLKDPSNAIRVQTATAIAKIENLFLEKSIKVNRVVVMHPDNPQVKLAQAKHYDDYAYTGILDAEFEAINRAKALEAYREYHAMRPDDLEARLAIGRLLIRSERTEEARTWFKQCIDAGYASQPIVMWYMESLYKLGRLDELRAIAINRADVLKYESYQPALVESIRLWSGLARVEGQHG